MAFPYQRMFTADNIGDLKLTPEAEKSGVVRLDRLPRRVHEALGTQLT